MAHKRFFELDDSVGRDPDGSLQPLREVSVHIVVPILVGGKPAETPQTVVLRPVQGTDRRIVGTDSHLVAEQLIASGNYREVDAPKETEPHRPKTTTSQKGDS